MKELIKDKEDDNKENKDREENKGVFTKSVFPSLLLLLKCNDKSN